MRLPKFEYFEPREIKEAVSILQNEPSAKILAGGTDLLVNMKQRVECPQTIVNIKGIDGLNDIRQDNGTVRIGALTSLKRICTTPLIMERLPAFAQAAASVGSYHHQIMGTLAGNICQQNRCKFFNQSQWWRSTKPTCFKAGGEICHVANKKEICFSTYCGDLAPVLLVMQAKIELTGCGDPRQIPIGNLFSGDGKAPLKLQGAEILTEIIIPREAMEGVCSYIKFANRESIDFPIVGAAFWASMQHKQYRVAFTAVDRMPLRNQNVEAFLKGKELDGKTIKEASALAVGEAKPVKTSVYSPGYKRKLMGLLLQSTANEAIGRLK